MFFENSESDDRQGEVRISTAEEKSDNSREDSKLKREAESKLLGGSSTSSTSGSTAGSKVSIEDVHRQNERIIELLEEINGGSSDSKDRSKELGGAAADGLL